MKTKKLHISAFTSKTLKEGGKMSGKNKLSIYLIKKDITSPEQIFKNFDKVDKYKEYSKDTIAYYNPSFIHTPDWLKDFFNEQDSSSVKQASAKLVLIKKLQIKEEERIFALTFGYSKYMFQDDVLEEQFGLKIILNSIDSDQIRRISKTSVGSNLKQSNEQLPKSSDISEFGFDINRDLMKNVSGKSEDEMFESCILTGGDVLSVYVERDISNIDAFLEYCYNKYKETKYLKNFSWVDNIKYVKNKKTVKELNVKLIETINDKNYSNVWMAVPDVVNWESIKDFKVSGLDESLNDIDIEKVINSLRNPLTDIDQLRVKRIIARSSKDENSSAYEWNAYKCIIAEIEVNGEAYCLNNGKWYKINYDFVNDINNKYSSLDLLSDSFIDYTQKSEDAYNEDLVANLSGAVEIHKTKITMGGGSGNNIEPCDVFWNKKFIHIKRNSGSSALSHLFNQALVSSQLLLDATGRKQFRDKLINFGKPDIIPEPFNSSDYEIVIAIINKYHEERPKIPFFSKVSMCFVANNIKNYGYKLKIKNIKSVNE